MTGIVKITADIVLITLFSAAFKSLNGTERLVSPASIRSRAALPKSMIPSEDKKESCRPTSKTAVGETKHMRATEKYSEVIESCLPPA